MDEFENIISKRIKDFACDETCVDNPISCAQEKRIVKTLTNVLQEYRKLKEQPSPSYCFSEEDVSFLAAVLYRTERIGFGRGDDTREIYPFCELSQMEKERYVEKARSLLSSRKLKSEKEIRDDEGKKHHIYLRDFECENCKEVAELIEEKARENERKKFLDWVKSNKCPAVGDGRDFYCSFNAIAEYLKADKTSKKEG